ncbi:glycosyltransferase family protein [Ekhidna sp.]
MIDILMLSTNHIDIYTKYSIPIWKQYCELHGYNFCHYGEKLIPDMAFTWSRIKMIQDHFKKTNAAYVMMVDADTLIYKKSMDLRLEELIDRYMDGEKKILFQKDGSDRLGIYFTHNLSLSVKMKRWTLPNAGFNIMKNCEETHQFIDQWLELGQGKLRHLAEVHPRTQNVLLRGLMIDPAMDKLIGYLPSKIVSKRNTQFCKHLSAMSKEEIAKEIKKEYANIFETSQTS